MSKLQKMIDVSEEIHKLMPYAQLSLTDKDMYVHAIPGDEFFLEVFSSGHTFMDGSIAKETVTTGRMVSRMGNKQLTGGIPYQGTGVPLIEDGEVVGAVCIFYATTNREAIQNASEDLTASMEELRAGLEGFQESMKSLHGVAQLLQQDSAQMGESSGRIREITDFIADVSSQTKLLGLNAAIEASHAKEYGAGFSVIAEEVRRLSDRVTHSVVEIKGTTDTLVQTLTNVQKQISDVFGRVEQGYVASETFTEVSQQLIALSERLQKLSHVIKI